MQLYMTELAVRDFAVSQAWYRDVLGLKVELLDEPRGFALLNDGQGGRVAIKEGTPQSSSTILHFQVVNLNDMMTKISSQGISFGAITESEEGYRHAEVHDPDGYRISLFEWVVAKPH
jgi:catechol 2,3-dioxygenase-like lactoylglutathione lyase family enzyme